MRSKKHAQLRACGLQQVCWHHQQADIRMRSHGLWQLVADKPVASCQQICCKLIVKTCYPQACCKLFQQVVTSLQMTSCNKPDFNRLVATWWNWQVCCNLLTSFNDKIDSLQQVCGVFGCVYRKLFFILYKISLAFCKNDNILRSRQVIKT